MIKIIVENNILDIGESSISFTFENPLFDNSLFQKEFSYSFSVPASPVNNLIFKNSNRIDTVVRNLKLDVQVFIGGVSFFEGKLFVKNIQNNSYSCYLNNNGIDLGRSIDKKELKNLHLDNIVVTNSNDPTTIVNDWNAHMNSVYSTYYPQLKYCFPQLRVAGQFTPSWRTESPYQSKNHNILGYPSQALAFQGTFNKWDTSTNSYFKPFASAGDKTTHSAIPFVMLKYLIVSIFSEYDFKVEGAAFFNSLNFSKLTIMQMKTLDNLIYNSGNAYNLYPKVLKLREYLPELTVKEFLQGVADNFNIRFIIKNATVFIKTANEMLDTEEEDISLMFNEEYKYKWSDKGLDYKVCYALDEEEKNGINNFSVRNIANGVRCSSSNVEFVHHEYGSPPNYVVAGTQFPGQKLLQLACQPVFPSQTAGLRDTLITWRYCISDEYWGTPENVNLLRLCNYIGGENTIHNGKPIATAYDYLFSEASANTSFEDRIYIDAINLSMNDTNGIFAKFYKQYLKIIKNSKLTSKVGTLDAPQIQKLIDWNKPVKRLYQDKGYIRAYVKTVKFSVSVKGLSAVQVDFLTE